MSYKRMRADRGTENGHVENMQKLLRYEHLDKFSNRCFLYGSSNYNQSLVVIFEKPQRAVPDISFSILLKLAPSSRSSFVLSLLSRATKTNGERNEKKGLILIRLSHFQTLKNEDKLAIFWRKKNLLQFCFMNL